MIVQDHMHFPITAPGVESLLTNIAYMCWWRRRRASMQLERLNLGVQPQWSLCCLHSNMREAAPLSTDLLWRIVFQFYDLGHTTEQIAENLDIQVRTIQRCLARYQQTGDVAYSPITVGCPRILMEYNEQIILFMAICGQLTLFQFIIGSIEHSPDAYLTDLQQELEERCGTAVSITTVWRTLRRLGFTYKKVGQILFFGVACTFWPGRRGRTPLKPAGAVITGHPFFAATT